MFSHVALPLCQPDICVWGQEGMGDRGTYPFFALPYPWCYRSELKEGKVK